MEENKIIDLEPIKYETAVVKCIALGCKNKIRIELKPTDANNAGEIFFKFCNFHQKQFDKGIKQKFKNQSKVNQEIFKQSTKQSVKLGGKMTSKDILDLIVEIDNSIKLINDNELKEQLKQLSKIWLELIKPTSFNFQFQYKEKNLTAEPLNILNIKE